MFTALTIGVSGFGRLSDEQSGVTNRVMFSYRANKRSSRGGTLEEVCVAAVTDMDAADE